ncbi:L-xylulose reductase [Anabrus simplex]|uniref:L-xylulose reductase n=1 Tax=Anabrus simplex TaxID=316456 RepID=UPI0035A3AD22
MEISFATKRILVTGAGRGIGREVAKTLVKCGASVIAVCREKSLLDVLVQEVPVTAVCVDLNDWGATHLAVKSVLPIDGLVNNAGIGIFEPFVDVKPESFDRSFNVNVKSVINVSQVVVQDLIKRKTSGSIVNVSSQASQAALKDHTVYCATKGAVDMITKVMALELGPYNIRVNSVNPTVVLTELGKAAWSDPEKAGPMLSKIPMGRFADVEEVVNAILFLLSSRASMITGVTLPVDGGFLAG